MNNFYTYLYLRNKDSKHGKKGTPYNVGKGCGRRWYAKHHKGISVPKDRTYIKKWSHNISEAEAFKDEIFLIAFFGRIDKGTGCLLNRTDGGEGGSGHKGTMCRLGTHQTEEVKAIMSAAKKGKPFSEEHKANLSAACKRREQRKQKGYDYETHKKQIAARAKARYENNKERLQCHRQNNPEYYAVKNKQNYESHREQRLAYQSAYGKNHREELNAKRKVRMINKLSN